MADLIRTGLKPVAELAEKRPHGDRLRYMAGCRCADCRRANTNYEKQRAIARKSGDWNGIVPADKARAHLHMLSKQGVGRRSVQASTDIADSILHKIRSGQKTHIRARTERLILAVTKEQAGGNALVNSKPTWRLLNKLLSKGYTKTQIAGALGRKSPALQIGIHRITVKTAFEVRKLFDKCALKNFSDARKRKQEPELPKNLFSPRPGVLIHRMGE